MLERLIIPYQREVLELLFDKVICCVTSGHYGPFLITLGWYVPLGGRAKQTGVNCFHKIATWHRFAAANSPRSYASRRVLTPPTHRAPLGTDPLIAAAIGKSPIKIGPRVCQKVVKGVLFFVVTHKECCAEKWFCYRSKGKACDICLKNQSICYDCKLIR